jgi:hypothetical protein
MLADVNESGGTEVRRFRLWQALGGRYPPRELYTLLPPFSPGHRERDDATPDFEIARHLFIHQIFDRSAREDRLSINVGTHLLMPCNTLTLA